MDDCNGYPNLHYTPPPGGKNICRVWASHWQKFGRIWSQVDESAAFKWNALLSTSTQLKLGNLGMLIWKHRDHTLSHVLRKRPPRVRDNFKVRNCGMSSRDMKLLRHLLTSNILSCAWDNTCGNAWKSESEDDCWLVFLLVASSNETSRLRNSSCGIDCKSNAMLLSCIDSIA